MGTEEKRNFTFTMSAELREAINRLGEIEDRSLSKLAEYLMWAGFDRYCKEKRLLSPYEVKQLSESFNALLLESGLIDLNPGLITDEYKQKDESSPAHLMSNGTGQPLTEEQKEMVKRDIAKARQVARELERKKRRGKKRE